MKERRKKNYSREKLDDLIKKIFSFLFILALNNHLKTIITTTTTTTANHLMCHIATIQSSDDHGYAKMSPHDYTLITTRTNHQLIDNRNSSMDVNSNIKYFVDIYTAALHLR